MIGEKYLLKLRKIFKSGYNKSLYYTTKKKELLEYVISEINDIEKKLERSKEFENVDDLLKNLQNNVEFSNYEHFSTNINNHIKKRFLGRKLKKEEIDSVWMLHSKDFNFRNNHLAKLIRLLNAEQIFLTNSENFLGNLIEKRLAEHVKNQKISDLVHLIMNIHPLSSELKKIIVKEETCLLSGNIKEFLVQEKLEEEIKRKLDSYLLNSFPKFHKNLSRRKFVKMAAMGIVGLFFLGNQIFASEIMKTSVKNAVIAEFIEDYVKDVNLSVEFEYPTVLSYAEGVGESSVKEFITEAIKYGYKTYDSIKSKPSRIIVVMGLKNLKALGDLRKVIALYFSDDNKIYIRKEVIERYIKKGIVSTFVFSTIIHETTHLLDYNTRPYIFEISKEVNSWIDLNKDAIKALKEFQRTRKKSIKEIEEEIINPKLIEYHKFNYFTEKHAMTKQINFLKFFIKKNWPSGIPMSEQDRKNKEFLERMKTHVYSDLAKVESDNYGVNMKGVEHIRTQLLTALTKD